MPTPEPAPPRRVTLLLCDADGALLGTLPPYDVDVPYWPETSSVVEGARRAYAVDVTVPCEQFLSGRQSAGTVRRDLDPLQSLPGRFLDAAYRLA